MSDDILNRILQQKQKEIDAARALVPESLLREQKQFDDEKAQWEYEKVQLLNR